MNGTSREPDKSPLRLFTIGFTGHSAEEFFGKLEQAGVRTLVDVRLNNVSQLAGFSKKRDLEYFLRKIAGIDYRHLRDLAPTKEILDPYKKGGAGWDEYERKFNALLEERRPDRALTPETFDRACLLCSEHEPTFCHRRLVTEYLERTWGGIETTHL